jgi:hypothetical protein
LIFFGACCVSTLIIYKVHAYQNEERTRVRAGVFKDIERRQENLNQKRNIQMLKEQAELQNSLSKK